MEHPFTILKAQSVTDPDGESWTVTIARGNQWQHWRSLDRLDEYAANDNGAWMTIPYLAVAAAGAVPALTRVVTYRLARRKDWAVTIRRGVHNADRALSDTAYVEQCPSKDAAAARAQDLLAQLSAGQRPDGMR